MTKTNDHWGIGHMSYCIYSSKPFTSNTTVYATAVLYEVYATTV